jgi:hypothetical protein
MELWKNTMHQQRHKRKGTLQCRARDTLHEMKSTFSKGKKNLKQSARLLVGRESREGNHDGADYFGQDTQSMHV